MNCKVCQQGQLVKLEGDYYDYISRKKFELLSCPNCGSKQTSGNVQGDYYGQAYYGSSEGKFSSLFESIFLLNHQRNAKSFFKRFKPRSVLEVGCGRGYMLSFLKQLGCKVIGIESAHAASWILNNPDVPVSGVRDGEKWPIEDNSIDLIIIWHVFEHVSDPPAVLSEMKRVLSRDGVLCISVPNIGSMQAEIGLRNWFHLDVPRHLFHFSPKGLEALISSQDLKIVKKEAGDFLQNLYGWFQTLANRLTPENNNLMYRFIQGGEPWKSTPQKPQLLVQLLLMPLIVPLGLIGWLVETIAGRHGSLTIYVKKRNAAE